mmetsp:Transcript_58930/g.120636  ORF Transcript_58930/g.120636 Transcript_58930/m.120636 type:complete len:263 (-) Transcript_58930:170-958(-)
MLFWTTMVQAASTTEDRSSLMKSVETRGRSSNPKIPFSGPSDAALSKPLTSSAVVVLPTLNTQSVMDPLHNGTRTARPLSFPLSSGNTSAIAVALPVEVGERFVMPDRPRRKSCFFPVSVISTRVWVAVTLWIVVIMPLSITRFSWITLTTGARQLVVQEAAVQMTCSAVSLSSFTPITTFSTVGSFTGALTTTRLTPPSRYGWSTLLERKSPVHSSTISQPNSFQGTPSMVGESENVTVFPSTVKDLPSAASIQWCLPNFP